MMFGCAGLTPCPAGAFRGFLQGQSAELALQRIMRRAGRPVRLVESHALDSGAFQQLEGGRRLRVHPGAGNAFNKFPDSQRSGLKRPELRVLPQSGGGSTFLRLWRRSRGSPSCRHKESPWRLIRPRFRPCVRDFRLTSRAYDRREDPELTGRRL